ncbi:DUF547 domain-containing protein [Algibacter miyuki]|uniref:DUF547 domain-containing protein n=1 Tax=Algibacter miyuki TaxID=1306933 RepID=A0ABV5H2Z5_9FLAO|nr:DUF547 domain-containing protein [Algibacter miyuki]MDN3666279.1 DUF547 domain-containing protein [Algibacter miyuki]
MKVLTYLVCIVFMTSCVTKKTFHTTDTPQFTEIKEVASISSETVQAEAIQTETKYLNTETLETAKSTTGTNDTTAVSELNQTLSKRFLTTHQLWDELLQKHVSDAGQVNYKTFKLDHKKLLSYIEVLNVTYTNEGFKNLSKTETLAFWINAYNAMTVDLILRNYPLKSIKDIDKPWEQRLWKLDKKWFNLSEIEHEILRKMDEPRIHFAIVCASFSCPKLQNKAFTSESLETQLTEATKEFLSDTNRNNISENHIEISKIFQWFAKDFKKDGSLIDFLNQYTSVDISAKAKKSFKDYNWDLNE